MSGAGNWLFEELDAAAREFEAMPDQYKPLVTGPGFLSGEVFCTSCGITHPLPLHHEAGEAL